MEQSSHRVLQTELRNVTTDNPTSYLATIPVKILDAPCRFSRAHLPQTIFVISSQPRAMNHTSSSRYSERYAGRREI